VTIDVSEGAGPDTWAPLPTDDRVMVGGHTVWTGPFRTPVVVPQPNRWGVIESGFPDVPCVVEADPLVTAHLPLPGLVVGFVDRTHRAIDEPYRRDTGLRLMETAARLAKRLTQIKGVRVVATPFARTVPLLVGHDPLSLVRRCSERGLVGMRPLPAVGGGVALSVNEDHGPDELERIQGILGEELAG
jgi:hypothetical protein